jgi:hypothetical protein
MASADRIDVLRRATALLDRALDMEGAARELWLAELATHDPAVAAELGVILAAHDRVAESTFLEDVITPEALDIAPPEPHADW